jgi:hypothetical protein
LPRAGKLESNFGMRIHYGREHLIIEKGGITKAGLKA